MPSAAPARARKPEDEGDTLRNIVLQQAIRDWEGERMGDVFAHPHALKHGLSEDEILHAWANFVKSQQREAPGEDQCVRIGYGLESPGRFR